MTCAPATGRRGEPGKGKSKAGNKCEVCCGDGQGGAGVAWSRRCHGYDADVVLAHLESPVECHHAARVKVWSSQILDVVFRVVVARV